MLVLDADSLMTGDCILRLTRTMKRIRMRASCNRCR